jgi:PadR family transcriptional regulator PadR
VYERAEVEAVGLVAAAFTRKQERPVLSLTLCRLFEMGKGEPRLTSQMLRVLRVVLEAPTATWYGLELARRADLKTGTVYPILARLEGIGWLDSEWEEVDPSKEGRPRRRLYRLSGEGQRTAPVRVERELERIVPAWRRTPHKGWQSA